MIRWFKEKLANEPIFRRLFRSTSWLFSANIAIAIVGLASLAFTARAVGATGLGILAVVEAYVRIVDRLLRLEPWQAAMRFGIEALGSGDQARFVRIVKLSLVTDLVGGLLSGSVAVALAGIVAPLIGLPDEGQQYIWLVALSLFITFKPTGIAVLRALDRFDLTAKLDVVVALVRMCLAATAFALGLDLWGFLAILTVIGLLDGVLTLFASMWVLRSLGFGGLISASPRQALAENPGYIRLLWNSNLNVIVRQTSQRVDVMLLSVLTDPTAVGFYSAAKRIAEGGIRLGRPLSQAIYPELVRLWAKQEVAAFRRLVFRISGFLGLAAIILATPLLMNMPFFLTIYLGSEFAPAASIVNVQILAVVVYLCGIVLNPAMLAMDQDRKLVHITLLAAVIYFLLFAPLVTQFGALGASLGNLLFNTVWFVFCLRIVLNHGRRGDAA
jgi:O-antigen/teichoic acid export membrane protein